MFRYGDMMSRPGSMMMGGGIGGYMPMSRLHFKHIFAARNVPFPCCLSKLIFFPDQPVGQGLVHPQELAAEDQGRELVG